MTNKVAIFLQVGFVSFLELCPIAPARAQEASAITPEQSARPAGDVADKMGNPQDWAFHAQTTFVYQFHPSFTSPYQGPHSLTPEAQGEHTFDLTLYGGVRLWRGAEFWVNPEIDQGFGLSDTLGVAGFPSGEAYRSAQPGLTLACIEHFCVRPSTWEARRSRSNPTSISSLEPSQQTEL